MTPEEEAVERASQMSLANRDFREMGVDLDIVGESVYWLVDGELNRETTPSIMAYPETYEVIG